MSTYRATQEMYDAAYEAYKAPGLYATEECVRAAVDAAFALVPVVTVDEDLARAISDEIPGQIEVNVSLLLAALRATFPASFVVGGEEHSDKCAALNHHTTLIAEQRADAAESRIAGLRSLNMTTQNARDAALTRAEAAEKRVRELQNELAELKDHGEETRRRVAAGRAGEREMGR